MLPQFETGVPVEIIAYQSHWPTQFERLRVQAQDILGDLALRIDHIGSTSVPQLAAKDIIDIQITVADLNTPELIERLKSSSWVYRGAFRDLIEGVAPDSPELAKHFAKNAPEQRRANIHIRQQGRLNQRYALLFRDFLRANPQEREIYSLLKQRLALLFPDSIDGYLYIKDPVMDLLFLSAERWATSTQWKL